ncbi:MAG TPA: iron-containing alcohol dehydrogenase [Solirubrobacterales bacterium]|jgi:alcohol dehydrogenase class IV
MSETDFTWRDAERTIVFRAAAMADVMELLARHGWEEYELLTTQSGLAQGPIELPEQAASLHLVPPGPVNETSAGLIDALEGQRLVALGGGRVIDTAKAIAAVRGGAVAALPTTLSGAELTRIHRLPQGRDAPGLVRPRLVVADPAAMTSLPERRLRASAMNALAHGIESLYVPSSHPVATLAALRGAELIAGALDHGLDDATRVELALGSLLCAYALDGTGIALHHVVCQTLVRTMNLPHAETNAALLPHTVEAMAGRAPREIADLARALGTRPATIGERLEDLMGGRRTLTELGADEGLLDAALDAMLAREQLANTPDPPDRAELEAIVRAAW